MSRALLAIFGCFFVLSLLRLGDSLEIILTSPKSAQAKGKSASHYTIRPTARKQPNIYSQAWVLLDPASGSILSEKNSLVAYPIASVTKMMTALVTLDLYQPDEVVEVPTTVSQQIGSSIGLLPGERLTVEQLLYGLLVQSGNDAALTLASHHRGGNGEFILAMNTMAAQFGLTNSRFFDSAGLDDSGQSSPLELAQIARLVLNQPLLATIVSTPEITIYDSTHTHLHQLKNSNKLLNELNFAGASGVKTGYTPEAGHMLVASATRGDQTLIAVISHTIEDTKTASAKEAAKLLDWGFNQL